MSTSPSEADGITSSPEKKPSLCKVCGDGALTINYGALTCASCRTFFRRNGFYKKEVAPCQLDGSCDVTMLTRRLCTACRLAKCIAIGMSPELIRKEDLAGTKRKSTKSHDRDVDIDQPQMISSQTSAVDLSQDDSSSYLTSADWYIISNVVHAFETFSAVTEIKRTIEQINLSTSNFQIDSTQSLQIISSFSNALQLFISSTPDYKVLTTAEQRSLFQRNILGLLSIGKIYLMRESGIFDRPENEMTIVPLYGYEFVRRIKTISTQLKCDPTVIKLLLVALAFSSNSFTKHTRGHINKDSLLLGTYRLFGSQNVYVKLIWKYLISQYNYQKSVQCFSLLIKLLLDTFKLTIEIYENNEIFQKFIDDMIEQVEQSSIINEKTMIPLWGKH